MGPEIVLTLSSTRFCIRKYLKFYFDMFVGILLIPYGYQTCAMKCVLCCPIIAFLCVVSAQCWKHRSSIFRHLSGATTWVAVDHLSRYESKWGIGFDYITMLCFRMCVVFFTIDFLCFDFDV